MNEEQKAEEGNSFKKIFNMAVIIMLVGLIFIALFTFFFSMRDAIADLFERPYVALIQSIFSLVVIGIGVYLVKMFLSK